MLVLGSAVVIGATSIFGDLRFAYANAGPSVFTAPDRAEIEAVRRELPPGATLLVLAGENAVWRARLWQRGLYPDHAVLVRLEPFNRAELDGLRRRYQIRHAVALGPPAFDPGYRSRRDLGPLAGLPGRVWFGELGP